jgi:hypothetical protein
MLTITAGPMMRTIWTLYGITMAVVLLRIYTQWRITCSLGLGDAMMALSMVKDPPAIYELFVLMSIAVRNWYSGDVNHSAPLRPRKAFLVSEQLSTSTSVKG